MKHQSQNKAFFPHLNLLSLAHLHLKPFSAATSMCNEELILKVLTLADRSQDLSVELNTNQTVLAGVLEKWCVHVTFCFTKYLRRTRTLTVLTKREPSGTYLPFLLLLLVQANWGVNNYGLIIFSNNYTHIFGCLCLCSKLPLSLCFSLFF